MLKLYGWQQLFHERLTQTRADEMKALDKLANRQRLYDLASRLSGLMLPAFTYLVYVFNGGIFDLAFMIVAQDYMGRALWLLTMLPEQISIFSEMLEYEEKVIKVLKAPRLQTGVKTLVKGQDHAVHIQGSFSWGFTGKADLDECVTLDEIDLKFKKGEFICVVGAVGSGKTSLLNAIAGNLVYLPEPALKKGADSAEALGKLASELAELDCSELGPVRLSGATALAEQKAWIENKTIKDSILFGQACDEQRYKQTIKACQLESDLEHLKAGDQTELGENGINLSGGQKARITLARAVYADSEVILLDDPVSALDAEVGKKVFD
jgi:ABC-type multidrug transport system fused ATPase/permease subunit